MRFTATTDYAIRLMVEFADEKMLTAGELSDRTGISCFMVRNILRRLRYKGFLTSVRGVDGGYRLACSPTGTSVYDVMVAVERTMEIVPSAEKAEGNKVRQHYMQLQEEIHRLLKTVTLADLKKSCAENA
ncbi:MAG: Rrf2 family transcriptional regulator [Oscillospiraceae bacterium]|nr:Rrf2 family transcriptional regulator [Oscillospiraceae bacterium]